MGTFYATISLSLLLCINGSTPAFANSNIKGILPTIAGSIEEPQDNFNPLTASQEDLKKYGFPAKPTDEKN